MVTIDVNSSRATKGKDIEETALATNLEAAQSCKTILVDCSTILSTCKMLKIKEGYEWNRYESIQIGKINY